MTSPDPAAQRILSEEYRWGVYDDDHDHDHEDECGTCEHTPCRCDYYYDTWKDRDLDD